MSKADELLRELVASVNGETLSIPSAIRFMNALTNAAKYLNEKPHEPYARPECPYVSCEMPTQCRARGGCIETLNNGAGTGTNAESAAPQEMEFVSAPPASPPHAAAEPASIGPRAPNGTISPDSDVKVNEIKHETVRAAEPVGQPTDEQIIEVRHATSDDYSRPYGSTLAFARAVLALYASPSAQPPKVAEPPTDLTEKKIWDVFQRVGGLAIPHVWSAFRKGWKEAEYASPAAPLPIARDTERLDYLDRDDVELNPTMMDGIPCVQIVSARDGSVISEAPTIREAIDAALKSAGKEST